MFTKGQVVSVVRKIAGGTLIAAASASDTTLFLDDVASFSEGGGTISVDGTVMDYTASDPETDTLTVPALASGVAVDTFVAVYPEAPIHTAYVLLTDDSGQTLPARIPQDKWALLDEGIREPGLGEAVTLQHDGDEWTVFDVEFQAAQHDASTTPIVVTTVDGESVRIDGDGITTYTNNPVPVRTIVGHFGYVATDGTYIYVTDGNQDIRKYDAATGVENTSGFPIAGTFSQLATDGTYIYAIDGSSDIAKYNAATGASVGGGFPIAGTFSNLATDGTHIYVRDVSTSDIRKYAVSNGVENTSGFPIAGTFALAVAVDGGYVFAKDSATNDIYKYDAATGVENTSGFPIAGTFSTHTANGGFIYVTDAVTLDIYKYDADTGEEVTSGFPMVGSFTTLAAAGEYLVSVDSTNDVRIFNAVEGYESVRVDSSDGTLNLHAITASDVTATGTVDVQGALSLNGHRVDGAWDSYTPSWTGTIGNGTISAYYKRIGKTVHFWIQLVGGSTTNWGAVSTNFTLPFAITANISHRLMFDASFLDSSASAVYRSGTIRNTSTTIIPVLDGTTAGGAMRALNNTTPVATGTGDALIISGTYETDAA